MDPYDFTKYLRDGRLAQEAPTNTEVEGHFISGKHRIADARNEALSHENRFRLALSGAYSLALAALLLKGLRPREEAIPFHMLQLTLGVPPEIIRTLIHAQLISSMPENKGFNQIDEHMVIALVECAAVLEHSLSGTPMLSSRLLEETDAPAIR